MADPKRLTEKQILRPTQTAVALGLITEMDFLRLKTVARLYARGLPADVGWDDLLQEALTRVIVGTRKAPDGVPTVAFVAGIIRSLRSDYRRRARQTSQLTPAATDSDERTPLPAALSDPERAMTARQELEAIERLFGDDRAARRSSPAWAAVSPRTRPARCCGCRRPSTTPRENACAANYSGRA